MKKKVLLSSVLTIALCLSLIAGSTFALFTSECKVNVAVTSGKVDVVANIDEDSLELYSPSGIKLNDGSITDEENAAKDGKFANNGTAILDEKGITLTNITPGDKVSFNIKITNNSNIAVKYRTKITWEGDETLFYGLKFNIGGQKTASATAWSVLEEDQVVECSVELPTTADNDYQEKSCTLIFTVEAVQSNADTRVYVSDLTSLREAIANGGASIVLTDDILIGDDELEVVDVSKNAKGALLINKDTVIDLNGKTLAYTGGTSDACWYIFYVKNATLTIVDSSDNNTGMVYGNDPEGTWAVMIREKTGGTVNIYGGHYKSLDGAAVYTNDGNINIYGGIYETENHQNQLLYMGNYTGSISIYGGSFKNFNPVTDSIRNIKVVDGYKAVQDGDWHAVVEDTDRVVSINTKEDLLAFADDVIENGNTYAGKIIRLKNDIDLAGVTWRPIMYSGTEENALYKNFAGVFDGNGYTIKNMTVSASEYAGFFGKIIDGSVKNVTFDNAFVTGNHFAGAVVAWVTDGCPNVVIENCTVKNSAVTLVAEQIGEAWDNGDKAGAIVGYVGGSSISDGIRNCTVRNTTIQGYRDIGGIVGYAGTNVIGCTVERVTLIVDQSQNYKAYTDNVQYDAGSFGGEFIGGCKADVSCKGVADIQYKN